MQNPNGLIINAVSDAADATSDAIRAWQWVYVSFMAYFSESTAAGTIQIQYSNDPLNGQVPSQFTPTNWADVPGSTATATVTSGGTVTVYVPNGFVAQWYRIKFTRSGGAGTFSVSYNALFA